MPSIKQRIRMFAQWSVAMGDLKAIDDLKSIAQPDHTTWRVEVYHYQNHSQSLHLSISTLTNGNCQVRDQTNRLLWQAQPSDTNFNLALRDCLQRVSDEQK